MGRSRGKRNRVLLLNFDGFSLEGMMIMLVLCWGMVLKSAKGREIIAVGWRWKWWLWITWVSRGVATVIGIFVLWFLFTAAIFVAIEFFIIFKIFMEAIEFILTSSFLREIWVNVVILIVFMKGFYRFLRLRILLFFEKLLLMSVLRRRYHERLRLLLSWIRSKKSYVDVILVELIACGRSRTRYFYRRKLFLGFFDLQVHWITCCFWY